MTKQRGTTRRSTSSNQRQSADLRRLQQQLRRIAIVIGMIIVVTAGGYYLFTGADPLGLFTETDDELAGFANVPSQSTPVPVVNNGTDWWEVYFTVPQDIGDTENLPLTGTIPENLISYIDNASQTIHIASFEFNLTPVAEALIAAHERGVEIQWVTDDEHGIEADEEEDHGQFAMLERAGIEVKDDDRGALMHNKFWIFDGETVWTGSTNITVNGTFKNNNNVIVMESPQLAGIYELEFTEMWNGEFGPTSPSTVSDQRVTISGTPVQVLFAAEDEVASQLVPLIESAQQSIHFMAFAFTHDGLGSAVLNRAQAGADVMGIFEKRGSETEYSELPAMYCAGLQVRQDGNPRTFHHKVFIVDGELVITGSFNFSNNADESNDENVIIVRHAGIATDYLAEFERRWAEATEVDPADVTCD